MEVSAAWFPWYIFATAQTCSSKRLKHLPTKIRHAVGFSTVRGFVTVWTDNALRMLSIIVDSALFAGTILSNNVDIASLLVECPQLRGAFILRLRRGWIEGNSRLWGAAGDGEYSAKSASHPGPYQVYFVGSCHSASVGWMITTQWVTGLCYWG